ncbi:CYP704B1 [Symbiodinium sp. CCMP2592]|nr:CYP704B1 [Symbiodinium sp. CCMP2592]
MADIYLSMSPQTSEAAQKLSEIAAELTVSTAHSEIWAEQVQSALCAAEALCIDLSRDDIETGSFQKVSSRCSAIGSPPDDGLLELERLQVIETIDTLLRGLRELERRTAGSQWLEGAELEENNGWASSAQADLLALHNIFQQPGCCLSGTACDAVRAALKAVARRLSEALAASPRFVTCKLVDKSSA